MIHMNRSGFSRDTSPVEFERRDFQQLKTV
jgi:hypothetical protein